MRSYIEPILHVKWIGVVTSEQGVYDLYDNKTLGVSELSERNKDIKKRTIDDLDDLKDKCASLTSLRNTALESQDGIIRLDALRKMIFQTAKLRSFIMLHFPMIVRDELMIRLGKQEDIIREHIDELNSFIEQDDEPKATQRFASSLEEASSERSENRYQPYNLQLIIHWMIDRFMLKELASGYSRSLSLLLDPRFVFFWMLIPYSTSIGLYYCHRHFGLPAGFAGLPFVFNVIASCIVLGMIVQNKHYKRIGLSAYRLLMPQLLGALVLGILNRFPADEFWAVGLMSHPMMYLVKIGMFFGASYLFVRFVLLAPYEEGKRGQMKERKATLRRRTSQIVALGVWQSFWIVTLFALLMSGIMAERVDYSALVHNENIQTLLSTILPDRLVMTSEYITLTIPPWAILEWTFEIFFISAIFERIMNRD